MFKNVDDTIHRVKFYIGTVAVYPLAIVLYVATLSAKSLQWCSEILIDRIATWVAKPTRRELEAKLCKTRHDLEQTRATLNSTIDDLEECGNCKVCAYGIIERCPNERPDHRHCFVWRGPEEDDHDD